MEAESNIYTPEKILPDGVDYTTSVNPWTQQSGPARKGTVAATLNNIALLDQLLMKEGNRKEIECLISAIRDLIPSLKVIGIFDLFSLCEWLGNPEHPGRSLAALIYLEKFPEEINSSIINSLKNLKEASTISYLINRIDKILRQI